MVRKPIKKQYLFLLVGWVCAISVPLGWALLEDMFTRWLGAAGLYLFLFLIAALSLGLFGFVLGKSQDLLVEILEKDSLTPLLNQQAFFRRAEEFYQLGIRYRDQIGLIMIDLDEFKKVNDTYSHLAGSNVLKQIGQLIHQDLRRTDVAARFGGDEFIAFLPRTDPERAKAVAERLRRMIEDHVFCYKDQRIRVTASFGVATAYCYPTIALDEVVEQADHFLYEAKKNGRNRVCVGNLERDIRRIS